MIVKLPGIKCKKCGNTDEKLGGSDSNSMPRIGDYTVCGTCGTISQFDITMTLIPASELNLRMLSISQPRLYEILISNQKEIFRRAKLK